MKHNSKHFIFLCISALLVVSSCKKKLDEAYENPNAPKKVPVETILPSMIGNLVGSSSAAGSAYGIANDGLLIGRYIQYWGTYNMSTTANVGLQYDQMGGTTGASDNLGSVWAAHYFGMGQNLNKMIEWAADEQKWDFVGAGWALRAWSMMETTNQYNHMILREAFNVDLQTFHYEDQPEIYDSIRVICHRALSYLNRTDGNMGQNFASADAYLNGGDLNKWKKFVYGLLARWFAYQSNKANYSADSVIKYADLSITSNTDNVTAKFANTGITGTSNYWGSLRGNINNLNTGIRQSAYIVNLMNGDTFIFKGAVDPRRGYILRENINGTFKGVTPGKGNDGLVLALRPRSFAGTGFDTTGYKSPEDGRYIFRNGAEFPIMTASEMQFLKAEAALRKGLGAIAQTAYVNGIAMNLDMLTNKYSTNVPAALQMTPAQKAAYLTNPAVVPTDLTGLTMSHIMLQKYIALYGWGVQETWVDMRRFHYTDSYGGKVVYIDFQPPGASSSAATLFVDNGGKLVYRCRMRYNSEYLYNIPSLQAIGAVNAAAAPIADYHTKECWFSKP